MGRSEQGPPLPQVLLTACLCSKMTRDRLDAEDQDSLVVGSFCTCGTFEGRVGDVVNVGFRELPVRFPAARPFRVAADWKLSVLQPFHGAVKQTVPIRSVLRDTRWASGALALTWVEVLPSPWRTVGLWDHTVSKRFIQTSDRRH